MKKLTTITLAVLILCLQVFSCTVAYGAESGGGTATTVETGDNIKIEGYRVVDNKPKIFEGDPFELSVGISCKKDGVVLQNIDVDIDQSSSFYGYPTYTSFYHLDSITKSVETQQLQYGSNKLVYKGSGNTLTLTFKYKVTEGSVDKEYTETHTLYIKEAVPTDHGGGSSTPAPEPTPKLVTDNTGETPAVFAGKSHTLKYTIKNLSYYQARNIVVSLEMADPSKAPLVLQNYDLRQAITAINANASADVEFTVTANSTAPEGIYPFTLKYEYENASGKSFSGQSTVYVKIVNDNTSPKITVEDIKLKQSGNSAGTVILELKLRNLGTLRADDVKVTLGGLKSGGFTAYNSTDVKFIDRIYGSSSATVSYDLLPPASGAAGSNELTVSFEYKDSAGSKYNEQYKIFVPAEEGEGARPNLAFSQISAPRGALTAGQEFNLSFDLKNNGGASARNVKVTLNTETGIVVRSMNPVYFDRIEGNKSQKVAFTLYTADDAATKNYPISMNVEYEDAFGNKFTATQYIGVFVENEAGKTVPRIIIDNYTIDPFPVSAGGEFSLKMSFLNTNKTVDVSNIKVTVTSEDGTFTPTESGNTFYIENIPRTQNVERELVLQAKPDAEQKSYMLTVNFEYEDEKGNPYTAKESISVRVLQSPRLVTGDISMMTETFVGQPVSVYLDFYNMGKSTLYNLMVSVEGDFQGQGLSYYVGNFEPGRTDYFDASFTPMNPGMQKGAILFTFEDANGKTTEIRKEFELNVMEMAMPEPSFESPGNIPGMEMPGMEKGSSKVSIWIYIGIGAAVVIAAVVVVIVLRKRAVRRKELSLDE